jgi:hypothetical protein
MSGGIVLVSISLIGLGARTLAVVCAAIFALGAVAFTIATIRRRPRLVVGPEGFALYSLFGSESHRWEEIEGPFALIKIGLSKAVGYRLTPGRWRERGPAPGCPGTIAPFRGSFAFHRKNWWSY